MRTLIIALTLALAAASTVRAQDVTAIPLAGIELNAHPTFAGVSAAMMAGSFEAEGLYAANAVMSDGAFFPPHRHPDDRMTLVVEGTMHLGTGEIADPAAEIAYPAGTVVLTPAGTMHWMSAPDGDVRVLEIGFGPSGTTFAE